MPALDLTHQHIPTNGVTLHAVSAGPQAGPLVILLHGFPEFWYGWRAQIPYLAAAGFRVLAPDQRGYNLSDKPRGVTAYNLDHLAVDVIGLIDATGRDKAILVGHDWGAAVAWWVANKYPQRLAKLVILNVPHPVVMRRYLSTWAQRRKSWYIYLFRLPRLPEYFARRNNWLRLTRALQHSARPNTFSTDDLAQYRAAWSQPGAITAMLNWYRALFSAKPGPLPEIRIRVPTLMLWGAQDSFLGREMAQPSIDLCDDGHLIFLDAAGHWLQHEESARVNQLIAESLADYEAPPT